MSDFRSDADYIDREYRRAIEDAEDRGRKNLARIPTEELLQELNRREQAEATRRLKESQDSAQM